MKREPRLLHAWNSRRGWRPIALFLGCCLSVGMPYLGWAQDSTIPSWKFQPALGMDQPYISSWRVIGPFDWNEPAVPAVAADHSEAVARQLDRPFLPELESGVGNYTPSAPGIAVTVVNTTNGLVRLHRVLSRVRYQVAYAECMVLSDADQDAILLPESDDGIRIWIDGQPVDRVDAIRRIAQFEGYVRVHLHKGANHVVVKLARTRQTDIWDPWDFALGLRSSEGALDEIAGRGVQHFFPNTVIKVGDQLTVDLSLFPIGDKVALALKQQDRQKQLLLTGGEVSSVNLNSFAPGPINAELRSGRHQFSEPVLYGSVDECARRYRSILPKYFSDPRHNSNLGALLIRFEHLLEPSYREHDSELWQKKIAALSWQMEEILSDIAIGREPYKGKPGTWIRGFQSGVDGAEQHYIVHAPPQAEQGHAFPLVIIVPYEEIPLRPFLYSIRVAEYSVLKLLDRAADSNGFGYIWADGRGNTYGQEFGQAELFEALAEVERDYSIDPDRIYLFGVCSGALHAFSLAADHPDMFAAVGAMSPVARYRRVTIFDPPSPTDAYACDILHRRSPLHRMDNLLNVPIMIVHGDEDTHNPISESQDLSSEAETKSVPLTFLVEHGGTELRFPRDPRYTIFDFFHHQSKQRTPKQVLYEARTEKQNGAYWLRIDQFSDPLKPARIEGRISTKEIEVLTQNVARFSVLTDQTGLSHGDIVIRANGKVSLFGDPAPGVASVEVEQAANDPKGSELRGPLSDAFTAPFLVVTGTRGLESADAAAQAAEFIKSWQGRFFSTPRSKSDIEITDADIRDYNLVLFGTERSNRIVERIQAGLPIHYSERGLSIGDRSWEGQGYSVQAVFPNPLQPSHYVVLAGDPRCSNCRADALQFTLHSWYDAAVWHRTENGYAQLADVGYFDRSWRKFISAPACH